MENSLKEYIALVKKKYSEKYGVKCEHPTQNELEKLLTIAKQKQKISSEYKLGTFFSWLLRAWYQDKNNK
jgi:hypothetical protein